MAVTAELLTILLGTLKLVGLADWSWLIVLTPVLIKYALVLGVTAVMARARAAAGK